MSRPPALAVGVTGHQRLPDPAAWSWVAEVIRATLAQCPPRLIGLSSLAAGADQLFARLILERGAELRAVLPFPGYHETLTPGEELDSYEALLARADVVEVLPARAGRGESYLAAGQRIVDLSDRVIAVWDGREAAGLGGTADAVRYALARQRALLHINPWSREVAILPANQRRPPRGLRPPAGR